MAWKGSGVQFPLAPLRNFSCTQQALGVVDDDTNTKNDSHFYLCWSIVRARREAATGKKLFRLGVPSLVDREGGSPW